jgi:formylglycine-generating enzyme required for sulfatase activity
MYPRGASAQGVPDLAGTIWEWCLNLRDNPRDMDVKQKGNRVLRGGSWDGDLDLARASYRNFLEPDYRGYLLGFRVVRVSPIS